MKLAGIFQDSEHLYDFETISYGGHFVFQNEAKILQRQVFIAITIKSNKIDFCPRNMVHTLILCLPLFV